MEDHSPRAPRSPLRLAIINDYELVVAGLSALLSQQGAHVEVVEVTNRLPATTDVDIVLMDTFASVARGAYTVPTMARHARTHGERLVVYSWVTHPAAVQRALSEGAAGYLWKGLGARDLLAALEAVRAGEFVLPGDGSSGEPHDNARDPAGASWPGRASGLSTREAEVLALIAKGLSNDQIAGELYLGINTVKTYIRAAYRKIGVTRRTQAVLWTLDHGFSTHARRAFPTADSVGLNAADLLEALTHSPSPAMATAARQAANRDRARSLQIEHQTSQVQTIVPDCVGFSVATALGGPPRTLLTASETVALLDAAQYLSGGPCVEAAKAATVLAFTEEQLLAKPAWRRFAVSAAAAGVSSSLSLPVFESDRMMGTINLYATTATAFDGHHEAVAELFSGWAPTIIAQDHQTLGSNSAQQRPRELHDDVAIHVATGMVANQEGVDLYQARVRLDDAAQRAGIATAELAKSVREVGRLDRE